MDSQFVKWVHDKIKTENPRFSGCDEFTQGLEDLMTGDVVTLMLGMTGEIQTVSENVSADIIAGDLEIKAKSRTVTRGGEDISLTPKEFDILYFLAQNKGEVYTKEQIYQAVWDEDYLLADSNIMAFIRKLRKKIEHHPDEPEFILTIWGIGYKFNDRL